MDWLLARLLERRGYFAVTWCGSWRRSCWMGNRCGACHAPVAWRGVRNGQSVEYGKDNMRVHGAVVCSAGMCQWRTRVRRDDCANGSTERTNDAGVTRQCGCNRCMHGTDKRRAQRTANAWTNGAVNSSAERRTHVSTGRTNGADEQRTRLYVNGRTKRWGACRNGQHAGTAAQRTGVRDGQMVVYARTAMRTTGSSKQYVQQKRTSTAYVLVPVQLPNADT